MGCNSVCTAPRLPEKFGLAEIVVSNDLYSAFHWGWDSNFDSIMWMD